MRDTITIDIPNAHDLVYPTFHWLNKTLPQAKHCLFKSKPATVLSLSSFSHTEHAERVLNTQVTPVWMNYIDSLNLLALPT